MKTLGERAMEFLVEHEEELGDDGFCVCCGYDMLGGSPHAGDCELGRLIFEIKRARADGLCALCGQPLAEHGWAMRPTCAATGPTPLGAIPQQYADAGRVMAQKLDEQDAALEAVSGGGSTAEAPPGVDSSS
jgi:hypothetical protein